MRIKKSILRDKCRSEKYYSSVKYMAHSFSGKERVQFVKEVCNINIYLGCLCAMTCEENHNIDKYIRKILNNYFDEKKQTGFNPVTKERFTYVRKITEFDVTNYLLANLMIGNVGAIKWYLLNHPVQKTTILRLARDMDEEQLVMLIDLLYQSKYNEQNLRGVGAMRSLFMYKNDRRIIRILNGLWRKDRDAFIQLAYDTNWLGDLNTLFPKEKDVYRNCLRGTRKLLITIELLENVLTSSANKDKYEALIKLCDGRPDTKQYIYLIFLQKIRDDQLLSPKDFKLLKRLSEPDDDIKKYFLSFFQEFVHSDNTQYLDIATAFGNVLCKPAKCVGRVGNYYNNSLRRAIRVAENVELEPLFNFYFKTIMSQLTSLDEIVRSLYRYQQINIDTITQVLAEYPLWVQCDLNGQIYCCDATTRKPIVTDFKLAPGEQALAHIKYYDLRAKEWHISLYQGSFTRKANN